MGREQVGCVAKTHRDAERCVIARSTHPIGSRPSPAGAPGPARPLAGTKAIRRAHFRLGHRAPGRGRRRARTVSGCVNSAFLNISQHFTAHLFTPWIPSSARDRRRTLTIQRGGAQRTLSAGSWFEQGLLAPRPLRPQLSQPPTVGASPGNLRSAERRGRRLGCPVCAHFVHYTSRRNRVPPRRGFRVEVQ